MSNESAHYRRQLAIQQTNAEEATLTNVRERCERAAATWEAMAIRAERAEQRQAERRTVAEMAGAEMPPVPVAAAE